MIIVHKAGLILVDDDAAWLVSERISVSRRGYCNIKRKVDGKWINIHLHHLAVGSPLGGRVVDHINQNPRDNRRENLRVCSVSVNVLNCGHRKNSASRCRGVYLHVKKNRRPRWAAKITVNGVSRWLGYHNTKQDAAAAYEAARLPLLGGP